ncbi:MAG: hypothetical protein EP343_22540 [Deltaproteobacteria bacterium]|nr:MAG: hypothetical protein EP343_22540 [Deltaproteobacteria bacterium]
MKHSWRRRTLHWLGALALVATALGSGCSCGDIAKKQDNTNDPNSGKEEQSKCIPFVKGLSFSVQKKEVRVQSVGWDATGERFVTVSQDGRILVRQAINGIIDQSYEYPTSSEVKSVAFVPKSDAVVSLGSDGAIRRWEKGKEGESILPPKASSAGQALVAGMLGPEATAYPVLVAGYKTSDNKGMLLWQSLDASKAVPAGNAETASPVSSVALRPDGSITAVGLSDGTLALYNTLTGAKLSEVAAPHKGVILGLSWSKDGLYLASSSADTTIKLWQVEATLGATPPKLLKTLESHSHPVTGVAFSPSERFMASISSSKDKGQVGAFKLWDVSKIKEGTVQEIPQPTFQIEQGALSLAWHPDPKANKVLLGEYRGRAILWVADDYPVLLYGRESVGAVNHMEQSQDDTKWVYGTQDGKLIVLRYPFNAESQLEYKFEHPVVRVGWEPDKFYAVAALGNGDVHLWDFENNKLVASYKGAGKTLTSMAIRRDAQGIAVGYDDGTIELLDSNSLVKIGEWKGLHAKAIRSLEWSFDGNLLVTTSADGTAKVWTYTDAKTQPELVTEQSAPVGEKTGAVSFNIDDSRLAVGFTGGNLAIWYRYTKTWKTHKVPQGTSLVEWQRRYKNMLVTAASPDDSIQGTDIHIWDTANTGFKFVYSMNSKDKGHSKPITSLVMNWNDQNLSTSSLDGEFKFWKIRRAYPIIEVGYSPSPVSISVRPDGNQLVVGTSDSVVHIWSLDGQKEPTLKELRGHKQSVPLLELTRQGKELYTVGLDGKLLLWDLAKSEPQRIGTFPGENSSFQPATIMRGLSLSPDQKRALVGGYSTVKDPNNGQLAIWDLSKPDQPEAILDNVPRILSLLWHPSRDTLVTGHNAGFLRIWDKVDGTWKVTRESKPVHPIGVQRLAIERKDGELAASAGIYGDIRVWRISDGKQIYRLDSGGPFVSRLVFHPNGQALAASLSNGQVKIWRLRDGKLTHLLVDPDLSKEGYPAVAHNGSISAMAWSVDGNTLFTGGNDLSIKQWHCAK